MHEFWHDFCEIGVGLKGPSYDLNISYLPFMVQRVQHSLKHVWYVVAIHFCHFYREFSMTYKCSYLGMPNAKEFYCLLDGCNVTVTLLMLKFIIIRRYKCNIHTEHSIVYFIQPKLRDFEHNMDHMISKWLFVYSTKIDT